VKPGVGYLLLGLVLLVGTFVWLVPTIAFFVGPPPGETEIDLGLAAVSATCTTLLALPMLVSFHMYSRRRRAALREATVLSLLRSTTRVSVEDVAKHAQAPIVETEILVSKLIAEGRVDGRVDHASKMFLAPARPFTPPTPPRVPPAAPEREMRFCRVCGNPVERTSDGTSYECPSCGNVQSLEDVPPDA